MFVFRRVDGKIMIFKQALKINCSREGFRSYNIISFCLKDDCIVNLNDGKLGHPLTHLEAQNAGVGPLP